VPAGRAVTALAAAAVAALAAAAVAAVVRHRQGEASDPREHAHLAELEIRLGALEDRGDDVRPDDLARVVERLQRNQGVPVTRLRRWISGVRHGTLSPDEAAVAESDFGALERQTDQDGV
jgi:hypothetical protein